MSYARINIFEVISEEVADKLTAEFKAHAPGEFPGATQLLSIRTGPTTGISLNVYPTAEAMEDASAARASRVEKFQPYLKSMDVHEGEISLNHHN